MGDQAVVVTGVLSTADGGFRTRYEIRRFKHGKSVFTAYCGEQRGDPPAGHQDLAEGTLRCRFDVADLETAVDKLVSSDVTVLEHGQFEFSHGGFHLQRDQVWDYQNGSLLHLVLPKNHLPLAEVESIAPPARYGWRKGDRFVIGWQGPLQVGRRFHFAEVEPRAFAEQAKRLSQAIKSSSLEEAIEPGKVGIDDRSPQATILVLAASPIDAKRIRPDKELRAIKGALRQSKLRDAYQTESSEAVRFADFSASLLWHHPTIVHFAGHGTHEGMLVFEDDAEKGAPASLDRVAIIFRACRDDVRLVVLNACCTLPQARAIAEHVGFVVGTTRPIGDEEAIEFSRGFYKALGSGSSVRAAFDVGCADADFGALEETGPFNFRATRDLDAEPAKDTPQAILISGRGADPAKTYIVEAEER